MSLDITFAFTTLALVVVVIALAVERHFYSEQVQKERDRYITALLSRNVIEYSNGLKTQEKTVTEDKKEVDEVELNQADNKTFDDFIKSQVS